MKREKGELKSIIKQKLGEKYDQSEDLIKREVDGLLDSKKRLTKDELMDLERRVAPEEMDRQSVKSGMSKMSGASQFDRAERMCKKDQISVKSGSRKILNINQKRDEDDLGFLDENNQWAAIMKYNTYMYRKEMGLDYIKKQQQKKEFSNDLDEQVRLKQLRLERERMIEQEYIGNMRKQMELEQMKEDKRLMEQKHKIEMEKKERDRQMKDMKLRRRIESKEERMMDQMYINRLQEEQRKEEEFNRKQKEHQKILTQKLLIENDEKKEATKRELENERQENIQLMNAYIKMVNEQEAKRDEALKRRDEKIKTITQQQKGVIQEEQQMKIQKILGRQQKYEDRRERKRQQVEEEQERKKRAVRMENKDYLFKQMDERNVKKNNYQQQKDEQAQMWRDDQQAFYQDENNKATMRSKIMKNYKQDLVEQMKQNTDRRNDEKLLGVMSDQEKMLNKKLRDEIEMLKTGLIA